jgi:hypothetical protein
MWHGQETGHNSDDMMGEFMMRHLSVLTVLLIATPALGQMPVDDTAAMRAKSFDKRFPREVTTALSEPRSYSWQPVSPKVLKRSLKVPLAAEVKLDPRVATLDRGHVERHRPALEQLALGLGADPPRPEYPIFAAGPRSTGSSLPPLEIVQLPPLSKSSDAKLSLSGDPATLAARPFTSPLTTASRGSAPPRSDIGIPDPFVVQREAKLPVLPPDADPPAPTFDSPERPYLPLEGK